MATSVFDNKEQQPTDEAVKDALGGAFDLWQEIIGYLNDNYGEVQSEWKFYSKKAGWCLKFADSKSKNLLFLLPCENHFIATVNMSEKIREKVLAAGLQEKNKSLIKDAKVYMEGISVLLAINVEADLSDVKTILKIKDSRG